MWLQQRALTLGIDSSSPLFQTSLLLNAGASEALVVEEGKCYMLAKFSTENNAPAIEAIVPLCPHRQGGVAMKRFLKGVIQTIYRKNIRKNTVVKHS